jgi:hypothetical protein
MGCEFAESLLWNRSTENAIANLVLTTFLKEIGRLPMQDILVPEMT